MEGETAKLVLSLGGFDRLAPRLLHALEGAHAGA